MPHVVQCLKCTFFHVRRVYNVPGPNHLWHMDGHHKLIRYGLVTHGCIDGHTRVVIYLGCNLCQS
jgi:hypothetical protein